MRDANAPSRARSTSDGGSVNRIVQLLRTDVGRRTIGELVQEREAAANEIERLLGKLEVAEGQSQRRASDSHFRLQNEDIGTRSAVRWNERALLRLADVCAVIGLSRSSVYKRISDGSFPQPVHIGEHSVRWRSTDIEAWIQGRS